MTPQSEPAQSEWLLGEVQQIARLGIWEWVEQRDVITWSPELGRMFGFDSGVREATRDEWLERIHPDDRARVAAALEVAALAHGRFDIAHRIVLPDGRPRDLHTRGEESARGLIGISQDVTEQRRADDAIRRALSLLTATLEATTDGILVVDNTGRIARCNQRFLALWNIPEQVVGTREDSASLAVALDQLVAPERFLEKVRELYDRPEAESFDVLELNDGRVFERWSHPQRLGEKTVGRVWIFRDVTERRRIETERDRLLMNERENRRRAEEALRARDEFLSLASHELRGPVTSLQLSVQGLLSGILPGVARDERLAMPLRTIERQTRRLSTLLGELLDVTSIGAGVLDLNLEQVDLTAVVREVLARLGEDLARAGCAVSLEGPNAIVGRWDRARLDEAVGSLLSNALRHGAGRPIEMTASADDSTARLVVRDHGRGIAPEILMTLFDRFTRGTGRTSRTHGGLGLGLHLAEQIVFRLGGRITAASHVGEGATFTIELPLRGPK